MMPLWRLERSFTQTLLYHTLPSTEPPARADTKGQLSATFIPPTPQVPRRAKLRWIKEPSSLHNLFISIDFAIISAVKTLYSPGHLLRSQMILPWD